MMREQPIEHEVRLFKLFDYVHDVQIIHDTKVGPLNKQVLFCVASECASNAKTPESEIDEVYPVVLKQGAIIQLAYHRVLITLIVTRWRDSLGVGGRLEDMDTIIVILY